VQEVAPLSVTAVADLLARHVEAEIELRIVSNLWPLTDAIIASGLEFFGYPQSERSTAARADVKSPLG
jgi:hypothetical protein